MAQVKKVIIYTTPTCAFCKMAKEFFKSHGIEYTEKDVMSDEDARREMLDKSDQMGVPTIDIDGEIVVGFDQARLSDLLGVG